MVRRSSKGNTYKDKLGVRFDQFSIFAVGGDGMAWVVSSLHAIAATATQEEPDSASLETIQQQASFGSAEESKGAVWQNFSFNGEDWGIETYCWAKAKIECRADESKEAACRNITDRRVCAEDGAWDLQQGTGLPKADRVGQSAVLHPSTADLRTDIGRVSASEHHLLELIWRAAFMRSCCSADRSFRIHHHQPPPSHVAAE